MATSKRSAAPRLETRELHKQAREIAAWVQLREERGDAFMKGTEVTGNLERYRDAVIVDVGCGPRPFVEYFPARIAVMFDCCMRGYRRQGLLQESSLRDALCVDGMAETLPFKDASVDHVFALNMLDHTFSPEVVAREFERVLKPGGCVHLHVDIGGEPTECEPVVFSRRKIESLFRHFHLDYAEEAKPSNPGRDKMLMRVLRKPDERNPLAGHRRSRHPRTAAPSLATADGPAPPREAAPPPALDAELLEILACVDCGGALAFGTAGLECDECRAVYPWRDGILTLLPSSADAGRPPESETRQAAEQAL